MRHARLPAAQSPPAHGQHHPHRAAGRILLGLAAIIAGAVLLTGTTSVVAIVLLVLLMLAGADLLVTGALGHCPLYQKLGFVPPSLRRPR